MSHDTFLPSPIDFAAEASAARTQSLPKGGLPRHPSQLVPSCGASPFRTYAFVVSRVRMTPYAGVRAARVSIEPPTTARSLISADNEVDPWKSLQGT